MGGGALADLLEYGGGDFLGAVPPLEGKFCVIAHTGMPERDHPRVCFSSHYVFRPLPSSRESFAHG